MKNTHYLWKLWGDQIHQVGYQALVAKVLSLHVPVLSNWMTMKLSWRRLPAEIDSQLYWRREYSLDQLPRQIFWELLDTKVPHLVNWLAFLRLEGGGVSPTISDIIKAAIFSISGTKRLLGISFLAAITLHIMCIFVNTTTSRQA
jgi:hypothetical protein